MRYARQIVKIPFQLLIGLRYVRSRRQIGQDNRFISFISGLSMAGIALGVAALIVVLSVMNGFQKELRSRKLLSAAPPDAQDLQMVMEVRAYREKPSRKEPAKGLAQSLWTYLQTRAGQNPI